MRNPFKLLMTVVVSGLAWVLVWRWARHVFGGPMIRSSVYWAGIFFGGLTAVALGIVALASDGVSTFAIVGITLGGVSMGGALLVFLEGWNVAPDV